MKIKSIKLHPFAGNQSREIDLTDGLNLMLGPNEAGKSSLCHAIKHGILTTTSLTKRQFKDRMGRFLPVGGGDVIRVTLKLYGKQADSVYEIRKIWRPGLRNGEAKLIKPGGTEITDEDKVQQLIEAICPVTPSTFGEIMLSRQSELHRLMERMEKNANVQQELNDVLRQSVMEAGGMSVDLFRDRIAAEYKNYLEHWDREKQYPQTDASGRDRGINNQWSRGVGKVLEAWYEKEEARQYYEEIVDYEEELDKCNSQLEEVNGELVKKEQEYEILSPIQEGLQQRQLDEKELTNLEEKINRMQEVSGKWPVYEDTLETKKPELEKLKEKLEVLIEEQKKASQKEKISLLRNRVEKLQKLKEQLKEQHKDLKEAKAVEKGEVESLRQLDRNISDLKTRVKASKLMVQLSATSDVEVTVSDVNGEETVHSLTAGEDLEEQKEGLVSVSANGLQVTVKSATDNLDDVIQQLEEQEQQFEQKLQELDVETLQDAVSQHELYADYRRQFQSAKRSYQQELGVDDFEQLKEQLEQAGDLEDIRDLDEVLQEREKVQDQKRKLLSELESKKEALKKWSEKFGSKNKVFRLLGKLMQQQEEIEQKLEELPNLPDRFDTIDNFNNYLKELDEEVSQLKEKRSSLREQLAELTGSAPEESSAGYKERVEDLEQRFKRVNRKAESIARVCEETERILDGLEDETYQPLVESFTQWLSEMSEGRFQGVQQERELPEAIVTADNEALPYDLLSHGTKDMTALAWKFTATEYFLSDTSSFILLDDPLVDMDPERRKLAAKAIQKMAEDHQVLVCTCHPDYRELMEGELIEV